jgi:hypothetical protein
MVSKINMKTNIILLCFILSLMLPVAQVESAPPSPVKKLQVYFDVTCEEDWASAEKFRPGPGLENKDLTDWKWVVKFELPKAKALKAITILHNKPGEGWSSSGETFFNKQLFPLVMVYKDKSLNAKRNQKLATLKAGKVELALYGQPELTPFTGGKLLLDFADGTSLRANIPISGFSKKDRAQCDYSKVNFDLGKVWSVQKGPWTGVWTRQGTSKVFTVVWISYGKEDKDEIVFQKYEDGQVQFYSKNNKGRYRGLLSCDMKKVVKGTGDWLANGETWYAEINPPSLLAIIDSTTASAVSTPAVSPAASPETTPITSPVTTPVASPGAFSVIPTAAIIPATPETRPKFPRHRPGRKIH